MSDPLGETPAAHHVIEMFTKVMVASGISRMPSTVFSALLVSEDGRMTAGELAEVLQISPAAVSGAVRYLAGVGMLERRRPIGARHDEYRLAADNWFEVMLNREPLLAGWADAARAATELLGTGSHAGRRMAETAAFFDFLRVELDATLSRWPARRAELGLERMSDRPPARYVRS